ncbi:uncharacterized protein [Zea mays]|uniref:uncharacterized protein isoform X35 n=1 Tax=Zea mays TaxID=4577 RepID=UPI0004DEAA32|nr:uncharacterized protein LOC100502303 isoform X35 [Zea mays]|eukprot:XP_008673376.1 hypothetical protein [Zea mays]
MDLAGMKRRELQALCKRHGLPAGGTNADLVGRLDAVLSGPAVVEEEVAGVPARKGCLKQTGGGATEAKKVTFGAEVGKARRLRSRVIWSPVVAKTRGKSARAGTDSAAEDGISADVGADVPVRRSRRNSFNPAEAEEAGEAVAVDRKPKRKNQENDEGVAVIAQARVTRRSNLEWSATVLPPAVEKKRGRQNAAESDVQKSALVEVTARTTRSRSIVPVVVPPTVVENKRRKTGDPQTTVELTMLSDVPRSDFPATRSLRNKIVHVNNSVVDETHTTRQLENKMRPSTRRHQQVASSPEDKGQKIPATSKSPLLRWSRRNYSEANSANSVNIKLAKDSSTAQPLAHHNSHSEDLEKQPAVKEPIKRSTRKSIALAALEKEKDVIEGKNPEAHVRRSTRKSVVQVKDTKSIVEETQYANSEDVAKQPATKGPARGLRRKSVITELHEKEKSLIAEKNMETDEAILTRKPVIPVKNIKAVGEGIQIGKGKDVDKQFVVKQPTRRSSRKSVLPDMLENNSGLLAPKMNAEMNVRRSTRKSVLPDMHNEKQDHHKMARNENLQSGKYQDGEKQQKVKDSIRQSRRSIATVLLEGQNNDEGKKFKNPTRRTTHKSHALNAVEEVSMDHIEVGEEGLKLRKRSRFLLEISSSANVSWKHQNAQISNEKDNTEGSQQASNCTTSKRRSSKKRRTTAPEEVMPFKVANDDIVIMEETKDTLEYNNESSSKVQEICQVNAAREEFSSGPLLVTVAPSDEICTVQSVAVVIPGSESGDDANQSSDKSKQPQEHSVTQTVDDHLSETRSGKLDQSTCITGLVSDNCVVSEDKTLMSEDREEQSPVSGEQRVSLEANANEPEEKNLANVTSTDLHTKSLQHDIDRIAKETDKDHEEQSNVFGERRVSLEANANEPEEKNLANVISTDLHTKTLQHDNDRIAEETDKDHEEQSNVSGERRVSLEANANEPEEKNLANVISTDLHTKTLQHDNDRIAEETDKDVSSLVFPIEEHEEKYAVSPIAVEKSVSREASACESAGKPLTVIFSNDLHTKHLQHDCDVLIKETGEDVLAQENCNDQPVPAQTDLEMKLNDELADPEVLAQENCNDQPVLAQTDLETKLNDELADLAMESGCSITERNEGLVAHNLDQEGFLEATPECKQECGLPEETVISSKETGSLLCADQSPIGLESLFSQESIVESVGHCALASATTHTENGFDDSKDCHNKSALENVHVPEPCSHNDTKGGIFKNVDCMHTSQRDDRMEGVPEANTDEEHVLSAFLLDANHLNVVINSEEVVCEGEDSKELLHSEDCKASSEKTDVNDGNVYGISDAVVRCALHAPADDNYEIFLGPNTDVPRQVYNDGCSDVKEDRFASKPWTIDIIEDASVKERSNLKDWQLDSKLEGTEIVESGLYFNKDIGNILHSGSIGEITPSGSGLSKDSSVDYRGEVLDGFSMEASLERSSTRGEQNGCRLDAIENPSITLATSGYKHEGALSEEAVYTKKNYAGTCLSNPRELIMELQSHFSKENINESDPHDSLVFPTAENSADEQLVKVHHGSNLSQLGLTDLLDGPIGCSNTDVLCQCDNHKNQSNEDKVEEVEAVSAAKYIESEVVLLPSQERSNLNNEQLNTKLESPNIMGSCLNCDNDVCNTSDNGSVFVIGKRTPSASGLPEDYPKDSDLQQPVLDSFSVVSSFQDNISGKKTVSGVAGSEILSLSLATPDYKHEDGFSEEAVCRTKNYTGTSSVDPRHLDMEGHSIYSEGGTEKSNLQDNLAFLSAESGKDEPIICHVEKLVDAHASSDTYQGPCQDLGRHEEQESCMSIPMQAKESGGVLRSSHTKGSVTAAQIDLAGDAHLIVSDNAAAKQVFSEEKEETKSISSSDIDILHEKSYSSGHDDHAACAAETQFYHPQKASISDGLHLGPSSLQVESLDALDSDILYVNTGVLEQHHKEGYYEPSVYQITSGICTMSEAEPFEVLETGKDVKTPSKLDEQLNPGLDGDEAEKHSLDCGTDTSPVMSKRTLSSPGSGPCQQYVNESTTSTQSTDNHPNDLPAPRSPEQSACFQNDNDSGSVGICQSSRRRGIDELCGKLQSFKVSSAVKGSYVAMGAPRPKPGDSTSRSAAALLRNIENTTAVKAGRPPVKPNADGKDSSRRALQPISGRPDSR